MHLHRRKKVQREQQKHEKHNGEAISVDGGGVRDSGPDPKAAQLIELKQQAAAIQKQIEALQ